MAKLKLKTDRAPAEMTAALANDDKQEAKKVNVHDKKYRRAERVENMKAKGNSQEKAEEIVDTVIKTKEQDAEPQPVKKDTTGPLGALVNGQKFYVKGVVGEFILEGWTLKPGAFTAGGDLKKVPVVRQIVQKQTATRKEEALKPTAMNLWFEETICTVTEDFALTSTPIRSTMSLSSDTGEGDDNMANKKASKKSGKAVKSVKASNGSANGHAGRAPKFGDDATVKRLKGPNDEQIKRHVTILTCLKEGGDKMTVAALGKALAKASGTKQDGVKVLRMHTKALTDGGFISIS